jgi:hypothetical protein
VVNAAVKAVVKAAVKAAVKATKLRRLSTACNIAATPLARHPIEMPQPVQIVQIVKVVQLV